MKHSWLEVRPTVVAAMHVGRAVVALESTVIAHGLPWPDNHQTALQVEQVVRESGGVPATLAVLNGKAVVGLTEAEIETFARGADIRKASSRDLAAAMIQGASAATTVAASVLIAHRAGIRVFATGGIGGVHPAWGGASHDISSDLTELARTPVAVVCAGAKSILDLPATLEVLETSGVPVLGYGTDTFPAFFVANSGLPVSARVTDAAEAAAVLQRHWEMSHTGVVIAQPLPAEQALPAEEVEQALQLAQGEARARQIRGPALTPFLLARLDQLTGGRTRRANQALLLANARLATAIARLLARE